MKTKKHTLAAQLEQLRKQLSSLTINQAAQLTGLPRTSLRRFRQPGQRIDVPTLNTALESIGFEVKLIPTTAQAKRLRPAA